MPAQIGQNPTDNCADDLPTTATTCGIDNYYIQKTNLDHCTCSVVSCIIIVLWKNKIGHIF